MLLVTLVSQILAESHLAQEHKLLIYWIKKGFAIIFLPLLSDPAVTKMKQQVDGR